MRNEMQKALELLESPKYRSVRENVTIDEHGVTVVQFFHYDQVLGAEPSLEHDKDLLREVCFDSSREVFLGTAFKHADNTWASDGSRVVIHEMGFEVRTFQSDLRLVLNRMMQG